MTPCTKLIHLGLASALVIATPMAAHAGTITVHNTDCRTVVFKPWPVTRDRVDVHIWNFMEVCSDGWIRVPIGGSVTMEVREMHQEGRCLYYHEAEGTTQGRQDVYGDTDSSVTCRENWMDVCQCKKD